MIRRTFSRLSELLRPPRPASLPGGLVLLMGLLVLTQAAVLLANQEPAYWLDARNHTPAGPFGFLLARGPWIDTLGMLAYTALVTALLPRLPRAAALALAGAAGLFHLAVLVWLSPCGWTAMVQFSSKASCSGFLFALAIGAGVCIALALTLLFHSSARLKEFLRSRRAASLSWALAAAWLVALGFGVVRAASFGSSAWQPLAPEHSPGPRMEAAVAYDTQRMRAVMFGGASRWTGQDWVYLDDTWEWDGRDWTKIPTPVHPSGRAMHSMAYDEQRGVVVLFGGYNRDGALADTWEWDGTAWRQPCGCGPAARYGHQLVYDPTQKTVFLSGGHDGNEYISSSCAWDGKSWSGLSFDNLMPQSYAGSMVYDPSAGRVFAFLGESWGGAWALENKHWTRLPDPHGPAPRAHAALVYDPDGAQIILFGGQAGADWLDDTWIFKSGAWRQLESSRTPAARGDAVSFYDPTLHSLVVYGGQRVDGAAADMWALSVP